MRIVLVCPSYQPQEAACGVGDYTRFVAEELARQGEEVVVFCSTDYRGDSEGGVTVRPIFESWSLDEAKRLVASPELADADILNIQYTPVLYGRRSGFRMLPALSRLYRRVARSVVTYHSLSGGAATSKLWALWLLVTAHHGIAANEEVTSMVRSRVTSLAHRIVEIPIASSVTVAAAGDAELDAERRSLEVPDDGYLLVHFGLIYPGKGLETLFAAFATVVDELPSARLAIVGETREDCRDYEAHLNEIVAEHGLDQHVRWAGKVDTDRVSRILQASDLYVVPYDAGVSIRRSTLMAGLAHGIPVISTISELPSAYLRDGDNVSLVPPRDPAALATRIVGLLRDPSRTAQLAAGACELGRRFTWPEIVRETRGLFSRLLRR